MHTDIQYISPELASRWLEQHNTGNRPLQSSRVKLIADEIAAGNFMLTHQGIAFAAGTHRLLDGQHRLAGIVAANCGVIMNVSYDVDPGCFLVIDQGSKKTSADIFGVPKETAKVVRLAASLVYNASQVSQLQFQKLLPILEHGAAALTARAASNAKVLSSATVRLGAVVRMLEGEDTEYVLDTYEAMVTWDTMAMPPAALSLAQQVMRGTVSASNRDGMLLAKALTVFTKSSAQLTKLTYKNPGIYLTRVRDLLRSLLGQET